VVERVQGTVATVARADAMDLRAMKVHKGIPADCLGDGAVLQAVQPLGEMRAAQRLQAASSPVVVEVEVVMRKWSREADEIAKIVLGW
jgi:hypothetical protein